MQARISELEKSGWITILEKKLEGTMSYLDAMRESHRRYIEERWNLLTETDKQYVEQMGW
jgi:hypothetical protein